MPRIPLRHAAPVVIILAGLLLNMTACAGQNGPGQGAETEALRQRVDKLERENSEERARLAEDMRAMRQDLAALRGAMEDISRSLGPLSGPGTAPGTPGSPGTLGSDPAKNPKSPRQALKDSLRNLVDVSKEALGRLSQDLDKHLARPAQPEKAPETPAKPGQQL